MEELTRLAMSQAMCIVEFSVQLGLNVDQISSSLVNKTNQPPTISTNLLNTNLIDSPSPSSSSTANNQQLRTNLAELIGEMLRLKADKNGLNNLIDQSNQSNTTQNNNLNEIVSTILAKHSHQLNVNQQVKHIFQWIVDLALYLTRIAPQTRLNQSSSTHKTSATNLYGSGLLADLGFLNEVRKAIVYMKLLFVSSTATTNTNSPPNGASLFFISNSLPVLPLRSSMQKDLLTDLFNIYTKIIYKSIEGEPHIFWKLAEIWRCLNS